MIALFRRACLPLALFSIQSGWSQEADSARQKRTEHYIGVQVNELVRQFIANSPTITISNPNYLDYAFNSRRTGWGMRFSGGYTREEFQSGDGTTAVTTTIQQGGGRIGVDRKRKLSKHWMIAYGLDAVYSSDENNTVTTTNQPASFNNVITTRRTVDGIGGGPRANLYFFIIDRLLIGTETTLYFKSNNQVIQTNALGGSPGSFTSNQVKFTAPFILWINYKF